MLLEINYRQYIGTIIPVLITLVMGWLGNLILPIFKKINDGADTKAKVDALKIEFDKHMIDHDADIKFLQDQLNKL